MNEIHRPLYKPGTSTVSFCGQDGVVCAATLDLVTCVDCIKRTVFLTGPNPVGFCHPLPPPDRTAYFVRYRRYDIPFKPPGGPRPATPLSMEED